MSLRIFRPEQDSIRPNIVDNPNNCLGLIILFLATLFNLSDKPQVNKPLDYPNYEESPTVNDSKYTLKTLSSPEPPNGDKQPPKLASPLPNETVIR